MYILPYSYLDDTVKRHNSKHIEQLPLLIEN